MTDTVTTPEVIATPAPAVAAAPEVTAPAAPETFIEQVEAEVEHVVHEAVEEVEDWVTRFHKRLDADAKTYQAKN